MPHSGDLLLVSIGNTRLRLAHVQAGVGEGAGELQPAVAVPVDDQAAMIAAIERALEQAERPAVLTASVNDPVADAIEPIISARLPADTPRLRRFGRDLPVPIPHTLTPPVTVGQDRLLCALGAFARSEQACVVIDAGTAMTVDFVDGHGAFQGGAIAPGLRAMLAALHDATAALPSIEPDPALLPRADGEPFGKTTAQAMLLGVVSSLRGLAHHLVDRYAEFYQAYPRVIATGGDAALLFEGDPIVERIIPDLVLMGMKTAYELSADDDE